MSKEVVITIETNDVANLIRLLEKGNVQISNSTEHYTVTNIEVRL